MATAPYIFTMCLAVCRPQAAGDKRGQASRPTVESWLLLVPPGRVWRPPGVCHATEPATSRQDCVDPTAHQGPHTNHATRRLPSGSPEKRRLMDVILNFEGLLGTGSCCYREVGAGPPTGMRWGGPATAAKLLAVG